jgi:hypothetical protein
MQLTQDMVDAAIAQGYRMYHVSGDVIPDECRFLHPADAVPRFFMRMHENLPHYLTHNDMRHMAKVSAHARNYAMGVRR